jgi:hypothetical protein
MKKVSCTYYHVYKHVHWQTQHMVQLKEKLAKISKHIDDKLHYVTVPKKYVRSVKYM